ncbi:replication initiator protein A [Staphylococcus aureus]
MIYVLYTTISNEKYKKLSDSAKVTYAILNDRVSLSIKNNWIDDNGDIYFIFINESLQNILDKSKNTITKIKKELQEVGLLEQIRTGFNRPNKLYLHDIETNISVEKNEQIRRYNRGEVSEVYNDKEKEQAQNAIRLLVQNANDQVSKNEQSYSILFDRYQCDVGYSEAKETIKNLFNSASTFGRKIQNDLLKNEIKRCQLKFYAKNYDENYQFRKEIESKGYSQQEFVNAVETNFKELLNEKNKLERREEKRKEIYQSAKDVYLTESEKNHLIVQQMYPKSHKQFSNDEKAFIVD